MLKNCALNWTLNASEILGTCVFLKMEKSTVVRPGPYRLLRPALPRRFAQVPTIPGLPAGLAGLGVNAPNAPHCAAMAGERRGSAEDLGVNYCTPPRMRSQPLTKVAKCM